MYDWKVIYDNGEILKHYNDDGSENLFNNINQERLIELRLVDNANNRVISLFLKDGIFGMNGLLFYNRFSNKNNDNKLIFFTRNRVSLSTSNSIKTAEKDFYLGFSSKNNQKRKYILKINDFIIKEANE